MVRVRRGVARGVARPLQRMFLRTPGRRPGSPEEIYTMKAILLRLTLAGAALLAAAPGSAQAQRYIRYPAVTTNPYVNPNYQIAPGLSISQYAYNTALMGRAYSYVPPYALGYNPYPPLINYGT